MKALPAYLSLFQINSRVWLTELSRKLGKRATLDDIPDVELDRLAALGFDWIWFLSVWQTGPAAQQVSRSNAGWRKEFQETLPDLKEEDIAGSGFAIQNYIVHRDHGSEDDLAPARHNYCRMKTKNGPLVFAYGRDPYFDGWPDTLQLNYGNPELQQAMIAELTRIADQCDGVRCDMAMLVLPEVFERTDRKS